MKGKMTECFKVMHGTNEGKLLFNKYRDVSSISGCKPIGVKHIILLNTLISSCSKIKKGRKMVEARNVGNQLFLKSIFIFPERNFISTTKCFTRNIEAYTWVVGIKVQVISKLRRLADQLREKSFIQSKEPYYNMCKEQVLFKKRRQTVVGLIIIILIAYAISKIIVLNNTLYDIQVQSLVLALSLNSCIHLRQISTRSIAVHFKNGVSRTDLLISL
ncbi:hypothetical protein EGR_09873 [Echinococcus granulosus]|uniref:Uncharacterized protein n=1 Tax=Echinococcus granulosus TaxID=6210 RepID=W6U9V3_ECHGR|nr:hypothetical protein EGR_09873 [Echinococcus granulosus]EUB55272.1 hypothetical protein EGR_09873 [Echinococcus granulosus]